MNKERWDEKGEKIRNKERRVGEEMKTMGRKKRGGWRKYYMNNRRGEDRIGEEGRREDSRGGERRTG